MTGDENTVEGNSAVNASHDGVTASPGSLSEQQQKVYDALLPFITGSDTDEGSLGYMFAGLQDALEDIRDDFTDSLPGSSLLEGAGGSGGGGLLGGSTGGAGFPSRPIKVTPKENPTIADMMQLPVEFSMGYLLIYNQLLKMSGPSKEDEEKKKKGNGIGGFFSNLLKGAEGLALIAIGLIAFAGAMLLFQFIQWDPALKGLVAFGIFVVAMTLIAKTLGANMKDFETFAEGILLMTAGIILFNIAIWISAKIVPYWPAAKQTIEAFGIFVGMMVLVADTLGTQLGNFKRFAVGVLLMIVGIMLFDVAVVVTSMILPFILRAIPGLVLFGAFVLGMAVIAELVAISGPLFVLFAVGILLLVGSLLLFGYTVWYFSTLGPKIPAALAAARDSLGLITVIGEFIGDGLGVIVQVALFGAALLVLASAFLLWGVALVVMTLLHPLIPKAKSSIEQSLVLFGDIANMAAASIGPIAAAVVFGASLAVVAVAFILWGAALTVMGLVNTFIPKAREGITATIEILKQIGAVGLTAVLIFIPVVAFAAGLVIISAAFLLWGAALAIMGGIMTLAPKALDGVNSTMNILEQIGNMGLRAIFVLVPVLAFAAQLGIVSAAFLLWGATLALLGNLSDKADAASLAIGKILTTFQMISNSVKSGVMEDVHEFAGGLEALSGGMKNLTSRSEGLGVFADAFAKISTINLTDAFKPLIELTTHQKEIDNLAQSLERISKAIQPPKKTIWDTLSNLTGGNVANPQASAEGLPEKKGFVGPSPIEKLLTEIRDRLSDWDKPILTIAENSANESGGTNVNLISSTGAAADTWAVHGPITSLK